MPARLINPRRPTRPRSRGRPSLRQRSTSPKTFSDLLDPTQRPHLGQGPKFSEIMGDLLAGQPPLPQALLNRRLSRRQGAATARGQDDHPGGLSLGLG